jgi:hypothetical protein
VKYFFSRRLPNIRRVLLVESGSRELYEKLLPVLYDNWGSELRIDLLTCFAGTPTAFRPAQGDVFYSYDHPDSASRDRLFSDLAQRGHDVIGIICSAEPLMTKWKWYAAWKIPAKVLIINENADFFWFDRGQWRMILHFIAFRANLTGGDAVKTLLRLAAFPFALAFLLGNAAWEHLWREDVSTSR